MSGSAVQPAPTEGDHGLDFERLLFFSDAVFAIAITLLIIEVRLPDLPPDPTSGQVTDAIASVLPAIVAYAVSFATIGLYWLAHWRRYRYIERVDERLVALNLLLLGLVAFIPFPTALIGSHGDQPIVVAIYAASLSAAGVAGTVTWLYAKQAGLVRAGLSDAFVRLAAFRSLSVAIVMLGSLPFLGLIGPFNVERSWLLIIPVQILLVRRLRGPEGAPDRQEAATGDGPSSTLAGPPVDPDR